jgi:hypothetical protein
MILLNRLKRKSLVTLAVPRDIPAAVDAVATYSVGTLVQVDKLSAVELPYPVPTLLL